MAKGEDTKSAVLTSALALASEVGLEGLTIGRLAERVGMSKSGLFAHFSSKEGLDLAVIDEAVRKFIEVVIAPGLAQPRGEPRVRALFDRWLSWAEADFLPGGCIFLAAAIELDDRPGPVRDRLVASQRDWLETLAEAARIAVKEGHFRRNLDASLFAQEQYSLACGHHFITRLLRDPKAAARTQKAFARLLADAKA